MIVSTQEMFKLQQIRKNHCVEFMKLPWNVPMVATLNGVTEQTVKKAIAAGRSLVDQLLRPNYNGLRKRDLNKQDDEVICTLGGIQWSWDFVKYIEYVNNPDEYRTKMRKPRQLYKYWCEQTGNQESESSLSWWLVSYMCEVNLALDNASKRIGPYNLEQVLRTLKANYGVFDKNKLKRRSFVPPSTVNPMESEQLRKQKLLLRYIDVVELLPQEHIKQAVATMLKFKDVEWLANQKM